MLGAPLIGFPPHTPEFRGSRLTPLGHEKELLTPIPPTLDGAPVKEAVHRHDAAAGGHSFVARYESDAGIILNNVHSAHVIFLVTLPQKTNVRGR
jgi:hypothetical protein